MNNSETHKECYVCKEILSRDQFYKDLSRNDGITAYCKPCKLRKNKEWRQANPETLKSSQRKTRRKIEYGISGNEFDNLLKIQEYCCAICNINIDESASVDHCHNTLKVRGLLCKTCNIGLGMFKDNIESLKSAIIYLSKYM